MGATRFAPAKVNLFLHVGDRHADGFHDLKSLVVFADVGDRLTFTSSSRGGGEYALELTGPHASGLGSGDENLVVTAARKLSAWAGRHHHSVPRSGIISLEKNLPVASGLGGGSSDAAAALLLLAAHWSLPISFEDLDTIAREIGSDVPVCLRASPSWMSGLGETIEAAPPLPTLFLVLVNPMVPVSTAAVFKSLQVRSGAFAPPWPSRNPELREFAAWLDRTSNDLSAPARQIAPVIMEVECALTATGNCLLARMSGSGATCFGIYPTAEAATEASGQIRRVHAHWWVNACKVYDSVAS